MDTLSVILIAFYLNVSVDSAKKVHSLGWHIPDTNLLFTASWVDHSAHVLSVKEPKFKSSRYYPLFYGNYQKFALPIQGKKTSGFGKRWGKEHYGVDIGAPIGTDVYPLFDGVVRYAKYNKGGYGNLIVIRHYNGIETYYAHLDNIKVKPGQKVNPERSIGSSGNTGHSQGPHLHLEIRVLGYPINPEYLIFLKSKSIECFAFGITPNGVKLSNVINIFCQKPICTNCNYVETKIIVNEEKADTVKKDRSTHFFGNMN